MLRLGPNLNLELQDFKAEKQRKAMPSNVDLGSAHLAFFVDDINAATQSLREHGAQLLRGPIQALGEPKRGEVIWYFKTPWGAFMENTVETRASSLRARHGEPSLRAKRLLAR